MLAALELLRISNSIIFMLGWEASGLVWAFWSVWMQSELSAALLSLRERAIYTLFFILSPQWCVPAPSTKITFAVSTMQELLIFPAKPSQCCEPQLRMCLWVFQQQTKCCFLPDSFAWVSFRDILSSLQRARWRGDPMSAHCR